ncbi:MAG: hypothetical protein EOO77_23325 [Oxalobacteraceae bacterium]|nr:MAG: hypothetical protein EOO77_23325 [Oxalobacteraceae bacterium]
MRRRRTLTLYGDDAAVEANLAMFAAQGIPVVAHSRDTYSVISARRAVKARDNRQWFDRKQWIIRVRETDVELICLLCTLRCSVWKTAAEYDAENPARRQG